MDLSTTLHLHPRALVALDYAALAIVALTALTELVRLVRRRRRP